MIIKREETDNLVSELKERKKKIVTTNGCFDILHAGHVKYLERAKKFGDILIVALNSDKSVKKLKGETRPINNENDRAEVINALKYVDYVIIFEEETPIELLKQIKPDIHVKGGDYTVNSLPEAKELMKIGTKIEFVPFVEGKSTTTLIEKMRQS